MLKLQARPVSARKGPQDPAWLRILLISIALGYLFLFLIVPVMTVLISAFSQGLKVYAAAI
jgi:sulfate/thiosulfate transport system permease protein